MVTPELIDHAAAASDRWLFLAALVVIGLGGVWLVKWLVTSYTATVARLSEVVERNSEALREVKSAVQFCRAQRLANGSDREP